ESLDIGNTQLNAQGRTDAWFIGLFPNLQSLNIAGNGLVNLHGIEMLRWLREIDASNNQLQDVAMLGNFKELQSVNLAGNNTLPGMMVAPIVGNNLNLINLNVNGIQIGGLYSLGLAMGGTNNRPALRSLEIANTGMQDANGFNFLAMLPNLARLNVAGNKIDNLSGLYGRTNLRELDLSNNPLFEVGMLYQMNYLNWLNLAEDTNVPCWQLDGIQSNLPQTKVIRPTSCRK
ncbi:MAG: hypothetical protein HYZ45_01285, partial [Burkholderiales bacterium]|nr:hypothetical protein [Burkholderiales bacterium]